MHSLSYTLTYADSLGRKRSGKACRLTDVRRINGGGKQHDTPEDAAMRASYGEFDWQGLLIIGYNGVKSRIGTVLSGKYRTWPGSRK